MLRVLLSLAALLAVPTASAGLVFHVAAPLPEDCLDLDARLETSRADGAGACDELSSGHLGSDEVACLYYDTEEEIEKVVQPSDDCPFSIW